MKTALTALHWQDAVAGLSIAGLVLPEAVAYSGIANLPPQAGIIALFAGLVCYGLCGASRFAVVAATSSSAAVLGAATTSLAPTDSGARIALAGGLVLITGGYFAIAGLARLGGVSHFIAKPVLRGFACGLAIVIILKQWASIAGAHPAHGDLISLLAALGTQFPRWNWPAIVVALAALGVLILLGRTHRLPGGLIVIALGIMATQWFQLQRYGVDLVGPIPIKLHWPDLPRLARAEWLRMGELGFALVMILYSESYGSIRSFAIKRGDAVSPDRDLLALGASNMVSGLLLGMPVGAGYSATSANEAAGATTRLAGIYAAIVLLIIVATILSSIALTPQPVLAAIVIQAVSRAVDPAAFRNYFLWRRDRLVAIASIVAVLLLGVLDGLLVAIAISLASMLRRFSEASVCVLGRLESGHDFVSITEHPHAVPVPGLVILRPDGPLFFANAERTFSATRRLVGAAGPTVHTVVLSLEESFDLDSSSLESLQEFFTWACVQGKQLILARLKFPVEKLLQQVIGPGRAAPLLTGLSVDDAVRMAHPPAVIGAAQPPAA